MAVFLEAVPGGSRAGQGRPLGSAGSRGGGIFITPLRLQKWHGERQRGGQEQAGWLEGQGVPF